MREKLLKKLTSLDEQAPGVLPIVTLDEYFIGNTDEECIAPNQYGYGRPDLSDLYKSFKAIEQRPEVQAVLVGLHFDWTMALEDAEIWPAAENVHIYTTASADTVSQWVDGMQADGVLEGWSYGVHPAAPKLNPGFKVLTICWD